MYTRPLLGAGGPGDEATCRYTYKMEQKEYIKHAEAQHVFPVLAKLAQPIVMITTNYYTHLLNPQLCAHTACTKMMTTNKNTSWNGLTINLNQFYANNNASIVTITHIGWYEISH